MESKYPQVHVVLAGEDGNAFAIMGRVRLAMRRAGLPREAIAEYVAEATSGDYDNLLRVTCRTVNAFGDEDKYEDDGNDENEGEAYPPKSLQAPPKITARAILPGRQGVA